MLIKSKLNDNFVKPTKLNQNQNMAKSHGNIHKINISNLSSKIYKQYNDFV